MFEPQAFHLDDDEAEALTGGLWCGQQRSVCIHGASIDSRTVKPGACFACLRGERVDGHDYADTAVGAGASLILAEHEIDVPVPVVVVPDVTAALGALATAFRKRYRGAAWIGITGSNGKTTVKELLLALCRAHGRAHGTVGNLNNQLGVPLTILATPPDCRWVVCEMGASRRGDIAKLAAMVRPDMGVISSIGPAHLEGFGDLHGVALGKGELFAKTRHNAYCGITGLEALAASYGCQSAELRRLLTESCGSTPLRLVDMARPKGLRGYEDGDGLILETAYGSRRCRLAGHHNLANVGLVWALAEDLGIADESGFAALAEVALPDGRLHIVALGPHRLFDDSYNANPASMNAGLQVLARQEGARLAVLGAMGELGKRSEELHARVGKEAARLGLPVIVVGIEAEPIVAGFSAAGGRDVLLVEDCLGAVEELRRRLRVGPLNILIKASRSAGLDRIVRTLREEADIC